MAFAYYPSAWALGAGLELSSSQRLVLLRLADVSNDEGASWYSQAKLAEATGLSSRTVRKVLKELEGRGLIRRSPRFLDGTASRTSDLVFLTIPKSSPTEAASAGPEVDAERVGQQAPEGAEAVADKPRNEPLSRSDSAEQRKKEATTTRPVVGGPCASLGNGNKPEPAVVAAQACVGAGEAEWA